MVEENRENRNPAQAVNVRKIFDPGKAMPAAIARNAARQPPAIFVVQPLCIDPVRAICALRMEPSEFRIRGLRPRRLEKPRRPRKANNVPAHMRLNPGPANNHLRSRPRRRISCLRPDVDGSKSLKYKSI